MAVFLLSIAGVCASDVDDTAIAGEDNLEIGHTTAGVVSIETSNVASVEDANDVMESCDESDKLNANPDGSFTDLANEIANADGELKLTRNYTYNPNNDSVYVNGIVINKAITIEGNGFSLNGNDAVRVFEISSDEVTLKNICFVNCLKKSNHTESNSKEVNSTTCGGAIYWAGNNGVLSNCSFTNCSSYDFVSINIAYDATVNASANSYGGAIYWAGNNGRVSNCSFANCHSASNAYSWVDGDAYYSSNSYGESYGGAIYYAGKDCNLFNCSFMNCYSYGYCSAGGKLMLTWSKNSLINIKTMGGAIYGGSAVNCCFINCYCKNENSSAIQIDSYSCGGAMYGSSAVDCNFDGNKVIGGTTSGAAMSSCYYTFCHGQESGFSDCNPLCLVFDNDNIICENNSNAKLPILLKGQNGQVAFIDVDVVINKNGNKNTYHCLSNDVLTIDLDNREVCTAELIVTYPGLTVEPKKITVAKTDGTTFWDLNRTINGNTDDTISLDNDYTFNSTTDNDFINGIVISRPVTINGNGYTINANGKASIFRVTCESVVLNDITFVNGNATDVDDEGGAVYGICRAINCTFKENHAHAGGAMSGGSAVNCTFLSNHADNQGGAMSGGSAVDCTFSGNSAYYGGAAMNKGYKWNCIGQDLSDYSETQDLDLYWDVNNITTFYDPDNRLPIKLKNNANELISFINYDVVIYKNDKKIKTCHCLSNDDLLFDLLPGIYTVELTVTYKGLDIPEAINITATIIGSFTELNKIINNNSNEVITLDAYYTYNSTFDSDFSEGIMINRDVTIYGNGYTIDGNDESRIFYIKGGNVVFYNITFINGNSGNGGAIYGNCKAINCSFKENHASNGGALYYGSAVDCTFFGNSAYYGGALCYGSAVNCSFVGNSVISEGGALYYGCAVNCSFVDNNADGYGGAMSCGSAVDCTFSGNTADSGGAAMNFGYKWNCIGQVSSDYRDTSVLDLHWDANNLTDIYGSDKMFSINLKNKDNELINFINYDVVIYKNDKKIKTYHCLSNEAASFDLLPGIYTAELTVTYPGLNMPTPKNITITIIETDGTTFWDLNRTINGNDLAVINLDKNYTFNPATDFEFEYGIVILKDVTINGNGAILNANHYSGIFLTDKKVNFINITFMNGNGNSEYGGGAILGVGGKINVSDCSFVNCNSRVGAAIFLLGATGSSIFRSTFLNNSASGGGAILFWGSNANVNGCIFVNNTVNGGVFYNSLSTIKINNNILLNNGDNLTYSLYGKEDIDFNWFGNNATDYMSRPPSLAEFSDVWLFLNASSNHDAVDAFSSSNIVFNLYIYNASSGNISKYNNTLIPINLIITSTNGVVDNSTANLGESIRYTATGVGEGSVTASIGNVFCTIRLNNIKANPGLSAENQVITYGENATIALNYNVNAAGKINITLTGKKGILTYLNLDLNATIILPDDISAGEYEVAVVYSGDVNFMNATANAILTVNKANSTLTINDNVDFYYGTNGLTTVSFTNASFVVGEVIGQPKAIINVANNTITVSGLDAGNYSLSVTTVTDENHNNVTKIAKITVNKAKTELASDTITTIYNINKDLVITLKDGTGNPVSGVSVSVDFNGVKTYTTDSNGQVNVSTLGLAPKTYIAKIAFKGNNNYLESSADVKVIIKKATPKIIAKKKTYKVNKKTKKFTITLKEDTGKPIKNAKVRLIVKKIAKKSKKKSSKKKSDKKKNYAKTNSNGKATFKVLRNKPGKYNAKIKFYGDQYYNKTTKTVKIVIK